MIFEHIEKLKKEYTDKYVVVDDSRPELKRFHGLTGAVKTVNFSGKALVEFDGYNNIGWYDIDPAFLRVVPPPAPKPAESKKDKAVAPKAESPKAPAAGAKPVGEKKTPAAAAKPGAGGSVADILAAARKPAGAAGATAEAKPAAAAPAKVAPGGKGMSMADILAAARGKAPAGGAAAAAAAAAPAPAKPAAAPKAAPAAAAPTKVAPGGKGMSMEEIMAMARGKKPGVQAAAVTAAQPVTTAPAPEEAAAEEPAAEEAAPADASSGASKSLKEQIKGVDEQVAYCRKADKK